MLDHLLPGKTSNVSTAPAAHSTVPKPQPVTTAAPKPAAQLTLPKPQVAKPKSNISSGVLGQILALICQEVGVESSDLKPDSEFVEVGIDSLLSLTITSKIREELGLDFPASVFSDHPTVKDLQVLVGGEADDSQVTTRSSSNNSTDDEGQETQFTSGATSVYPDTPQHDVPSSSDRTRACLLVRQVIAEETRVAIDELKPSTSLADIGVDSLLTLTITGKLQELLEVDSARDLFVECDTLQDVEESLCKALGFTSKPKELSCSYPSMPMNSSPGIPALQSDAAPSLPQATSILLSGSPKTARQILFLFPDGSGSASSYAAVAPVIDTSTVAIYGLNCPWRKTGAEMGRLGLTMSTMVSRYVVEVRRLLQAQTTNAQIALGGWSAGGILAVEAVRQLQQGTGAVKIDELILFDSPNPIGLQNPPQRMYDFFDSLGIFGGGQGKTPKWLREHFDSFLRILDNYEPTPLPDAPTSLIVYARDGILKDPNGPKMETSPDDPREMLWLLNNRTDFSADGWASIVGRDRLSVRVLDEVNHFSLMDPGSKMGELGQIVSRFLSG